MPIVQANSLPTAVVDGLSVGVPNRGTTYSEQFVSLIEPNKYPLCNEGTYVVSTNPTPGTALASGVIASYSATAAGLMVLNNTDVTGGKSLHLDYIKIIPTVAPASATSAQFALWLDKQNLYSSGGTLQTAVNPNGNSARVPVGGLYTASGGTVITVAGLGANKRLVGRGVLRSVIPVVQDELIIKFGSYSDPGTSGSTGAGRYATEVSPVEIPPGWSLALVMWFPSNTITGISFENEAAWYER